jgi:hypothetical protein
VADTAELTLSSRRQVLLAEVRWGRGVYVGVYVVYDSNGAAEFICFFFMWQIQELQSALSGRLTELASLG